MNFLRKCHSHILLIYYLMTSCRAVNREIILTEDKPYDVININVPLHILKLAIEPSPPLLKSQSTVVLPIQVNDNYNDEDDYDESVADENDIIDQQSPVDVIEEPQIVPEEVVVPTQTVLESTEPPVQADVTQVPLQDEISDETVNGNVTGQVLRFPCSCVSGQCGCCTGMILQRLRMNACGNISFVPEDFVFDVRLSVNDNTVVRRRVSASDPPPICFNPRRLPFVQVCAEISNIRIRNRNAFACLDINANIGGFQVFSTSFRCFGLGTSGVQSGLKPKPVSSGPTPINLFGGNGGSEDAGGSGLLSNPAGAILGGPEGILGGVAEGIFGGEGGALDAIGDAVGDFVERRNL